MFKCFKIQIAVLVSLFFCSVFTFGANSFSDIWNQLTSAHEEVLVEIENLTEISNNLSTNLNTNIKTKKGLESYRVQVEDILEDVKSLTAKYQTKLKLARNIVSDFAVSTEGKKADDTFEVKYDDFYLTKMQEYRQRVSFYKGVLLRLRLIQEQCHTTINRIEDIRQEMYLGHLWVSNEPFYKLSAWEKAINEIETYSVKLSKDLIDTSGKLTQNILSIKFWLLLIGFILGFAFYIKLIRPRTSKLIKVTMLEGNFTDSLTKKFFVVFVYIIVRGAIPVLLIFLLKNIVLNALGLDKSLLLTTFINPLFNALAFIVIMLALVFVMLNQKLEFIKFKEANFFQRQIIIIIFEIGGIFFIKNINFFSTEAPTTGYFPDQATALINLILSFLIVISFYRLCYSRKSKLEESKS